MSSFEKRINDNINEGIAKPVFENETKTFEIIRKKLSEYGYQGYNGVTKTYMIDGTDCFHSGVATIFEFNGGIGYSVCADEIGNVFLGSVTQKEVEFPQYGTKTLMEHNGHGGKKIAGFEKSGNLPLSEVKGTVIETIEKTVREHPVMGKYADMILGDFKNILSLDPKREITPISEEAMINATLKEDNQRKDIQIGRLQGMLNKTLEFAKNVRDSVVGKIFFKNKIAQLNLPEGELAEGDKDER